MSVYRLPSILRYVIAIAIFAALLLVPYGLQRAFSFSFDTTFLIIISMIACAWYLGRGPGLLVALMFESALVYFSQPGFTTRAVIVTLNRLLLFVSIVWFASARRHAETRLREQRELLRVTLASIGDAVIATDIEGRVTFINPAAEMLTGWKESDACDRPLDDVFRIINEYTRLDVESPFKAIKRDGLTIGLANHTLLIRPDGTELPIDDSGAPIKDSHGKTIGAVIVFHDVTERRQAEREREQLLASEKAARSEAETASRLKDEFLATVSHELRTPLNAILGWTGLMQQSFPDPESLRTALDVIERNAKAQNRLIGDVLDVSRIVTGKMKVEPRPVDVGGVVRAAVDTMFPALTAKGITVNMADENGRQLVLGDPERLQQVFWNLLSNSIKFTPANGSIDIGIDNVGDNVEISIRDTGVGIDALDLPHIFERFRQIDSSTRRSQGGLGLGLAIVRHLVELHGGTVSAHSDGSGTGATFCVKLPVTGETAAVTDRQDPAAMPQLQGLKVLVVDDNIDSLEMCCLSLEQLGAETRSAASCSVALDILDEWRPDVLISDLGMPGEDGFDLIRAVRSRSAEQGGSIPAAALTAYARDEDRARALDAGFQAHIPKPVEPLVLAAEVASLVRKNK